MEKDFVRDWFVQRGAVTQEEMDHAMDQNYLEQGWIDSFGFLELIETCEQKFKMTFSDDDFSDEKIFTVSGLIEILKKANK